MTALKLHLLAASALPLMTATACNARPATPDRIAITIGGTTFHATLENNATAKAFVEMLPLTLKMEDLHQNEKFHRFRKSLPANDANPGTIRTGDLMIWSSDTIVLFYKDFRTNYDYTRLGRVEDPRLLAEKIGRGDITVTFTKSP